MNEEELKQKCEEYLSGWKRALADYDNLKKDLVREKGQMRRALTEELLLVLLPIMDSFDAAMKFTPRVEDQKIETWLSGVLQVRTQLDSALRGLGAEPFGREGDLFEPSLYESAGSRKDESKPDHAVLEVVQRGWKFSDKIIRPSNVVINTL